MPEKPKGKKSKCNKKQRLGILADKSKPVTENISASLPKPEGTNNLNDSQPAKIIDEDNQSFKQDSQFAKNIDDDNQSFKQDSHPSAKNMDDDNQSFKQGKYKFLINYIILCIVILISQWDCLNENEARQQKLES